VFVLNERDEEHVLVPSDDKDPLAGVAVGMRVFEDVEKVAPLDVKDDILEPDIAVRPELRVLGFVPGEELHSKQRVPRRVPNGHTLASRTLCPDRLKRGPFKTNAGKQR